MRKCPICKKEKETPLCPVCGFDESLDYRSFRAFSRLSAKTEQAFWEKRNGRVDLPGFILLRKEMRNVFHI